MKNTNAPRNATQANALAVRLERAKAILAEGYTFQRDTVHANCITVMKPGRLAASYWIIDGECDCKDSQNGNHCKHEIAWGILQDEAEAAKASSLFDEDVAACEQAAAEYDARQEGRYEMPLPPLPTVNAEHNALMSNRGNNPEVKPPFLFGDAPDARALAVLNTLRERMLDERRNARAKGWSGRTDDMAVAMTVLDEFMTKYQSGWFEL